MYICIFRCTQKNLHVHAHNLIISRNKFLIFKYLVLLIIYTAHQKFVCTYRGTLQGFFSLYQAGTSLQSTEETHKTRKGEV